MASDLPSIGYECPLFGIGSIQQFHSLLARSRNSDLKSAVAKGLFNDTLNELVVFNDQDNRQVFQCRDSRSPASTSREPVFSSGRNVQKCT